MKTKSLFHSLSAEDRQGIFDLCEAHPYDAVVEMIAHPRAQGGFDLRTSSSSLRRFYIGFNPRAQHVQTLEQYAQSWQLGRQHAEGAFFAAIVAHVETSLLEALKNGRPVADLEKEFQTLARLHRTFLAHEEWRTARSHASKRELEKFQEEDKEDDSDTSAEPVKSDSDSPSDSLPLPDDPASSDDKDADDNKLDADGLSRAEHKAIDLLVNSGDKNALTQFFDNPDKLVALGRDLADAKRKIAGNGSPSAGQFTISHAKTPAKPHYSRKK